jgi:hypothetical protein
MELRMFAAGFGATVIILALLSWAVLARVLRLRHL